jgi:hypothetical protein
VLIRGERCIGGNAIAVGDDAVGHSTAGAADQGDAFAHGGARYPDATTGCE